MTLSTNGFNECTSVHMNGIISKELHPGPERSRQSNLAVFTIEGGLDSKFSSVK